MISVLCDDNMKWKQMFHRFYASVTSRDSVLLFVHIFALVTGDE